MKKVKVLFLVALAVFVGALSFSTSGCKSTTTDPGAEPITDDLFPLVVGHQLVFSGHLLNSSDQEVAGTSAFYEARMTVASNSAPSPTGGTAHAISDSQLVTPPSTWFINTYLVQRASATGSGNISFLTNIGLIYRTFNIREGDNIRSDSLQWVLLVNQEAGVDNPWTAFEAEWSGQAQGVNATIRLLVEGEITQESVTVPGGTFEGAYKVSARRKVFVNGVQALDLPTAEIWLVADIGIVQFTFHADGESGGFHREYESDNF